MPLKKILYRPYITQSQKWHNFLRNSIKTIKYRLKWTNNYLLCFVIFHGKADICTYYTYSVFQTVIYVHGLLLFFKRLCPTHKCCKKTERWHLQINTVLYISAAGSAEPRFHREMSIYLRVWDTLLEYFHSDAVSVLQGHRQVLMLGGWWGQFPRRKAMPDTLLVGL